MNIHDLTVRTTVCWGFVDGGGDLQPYTFINSHIYNTIWIWICSHLQIARLKSNQFDEEKIIHKSSEFYRYFVELSGTADLMIRRFFLFSFFVVYLFFFLLFFVRKNGFDVHVLKVYTHEQMTIGKVIYTLCYVLFWVVISFGSLGCELCQRTEKKTE